MKYTLLELIQRVLSSIKGEEVNNYDDTAESLVVRDIVKECYYNLLSQQDFPEHNTLFELNASGDNTKPTVMFIPDNVISLEWVKYNKETTEDTDPAFMEINYLPLKDFLQMNHSMSLSESNVSSFTIDTGNSDSIDFLYRDDKAPDFYTSFDDHTLIFDSFDLTVDTTLKKNKTLCFGMKEAEWEDDNSFTPDLDSQQFSILLKDCKYMAWQELRQTENMAALRDSRRSRIAAERKKTRSNYNHKLYYYTEYPNYGRK